MPDPQPQPQSKPQPKPVKMPDPKPQPQPVKMPEPTPRPFLSTGFSVLPRVLRSALLSNECELAMDVSSLTIPMTNVSPTVLHISFLGHKLRRKQP
ncbi:hypothetical protein E3N88_43952 [Mikania micrantha]|uniref:Uncharacterized protein n=1 Tax=Mikania micrantha TaxID=192012 RepID=A0A5N6LDF9_9ASTR|nr:hypothetical protein E3N88_43952 [Mikania micrantha]